MSSCVNIIHILVSIIVLFGSIQFFPAPLGSFYPILFGHFRFFLALFGPFRPFSALFGSFRSFSVISRTLQTHTICSLNILNNFLYNASYYMCRKISSHWQPLFCKIMVAPASFSYKISGVGPVASFSYKIGGGGFIFLQNWRRQQGFVNITGGCSDMVWILANRQQ